MVEVFVERAPDVDGDGLLPLLLLHHQPQLPGSRKTRGHDKRKECRKIVPLQSGTKSINLKALNLIAKYIKKSIIIVVILISEMLRLIIW